MLAKEAALRSIKDMFFMFYFLVTRPLRLESRIGIFKTLIAFVVASFLLINFLIWPMLDNYIFKHDKNTIYLNILEPPGFARNASYLCEFKTYTKDNTILSYNQSYDGRTISIATGDGDFSKSNCRQYFPGYLFNDYTVQGTIINVFYTGNMHTVLNSTRDYKEVITIHSHSPMKLFIRNKNAVLVQQSENMGSLMRGIARLSHSVKEGFSYEGGYLNYSRHFVFKHPERFYVHKNFHHPQVFAYDLPNLNKWEVTKYASYSYEPKLSVELQIPQKRSGESFQTFFKIEGAISSREFLYFGSTNLKIAAYDFIDSEDLGYFSKAMFYGKPLVYGLITIFLAFFLINAYSLKSGTKLADVSYTRPHLDDVIRQSRTTPSGYPEPTRAKFD